jgi:hypothetical protein
MLTVVRFVLRMLHGSVHALIAALACRAHYEPTALLLDDTRIAAALQSIATIEALVTPPHSLDASVRAHDVSMEALDPGLLAGVRSCDDAEDFDNDDDDDVDHT